MYRRLAFAGIRVIAFRSIAFRMRIITATIPTDTTLTSITTSVTVFLDAAVVGFIS